MVGARTLPQGLAAVQVTVAYIQERVCAGLARARGEGPPAQRVTRAARLSCPGASERIAGEVAAAMVELVQSKRSARVRAAPASCAWRGWREHVALKGRRAPARAATSSATMYPIEHSPRIIPGGDRGGTGRERGSAGVQPFQKPVLPRLVGLNALPDFKTPRRAELVGVMAMADQTKSSAAVMATLHQKPPRRLSQTGAPTPTMEQRFDELYCSLWLPRSSMTSLHGMRASRPYRSAA
jgi:hypothetical protein